jgi:hypothetical protein
MDFNLPSKHAFIVWAVVGLYLLHIATLYFIPAVYESWVKGVGVAGALWTSLPALLAVSNCFIVRAVTLITNELIWAADAVLIFMLSIVVPFIWTALRNKRLKLREREAEEWKVAGIPDNPPPITLSNIDTKITHVETNIINLSDRKPYSGAGVTFQE